MAIRSGHATRATRLAGAIALAASLTASLGVWACDRASAPPRPEPPARASVASERAAPPPLAERPFRFPAPRRLAAIGDVHGDLAATRAALRLAGAIDAEDRWSGADLVVVQTGDQLDRGDDERAILDLLKRLGAEARRAGGEVHVLNGNHETMNVALDFRYVTAGGFAAFADVRTDARGLGRFPEAHRGRAMAFAPGGPYARELAARETVIVVGETVFAHGGVLPAHVKYGVARFNAEVSAWMRGERAAPALAQVDDGPVWARTFSEDEVDASECALLAEALGALGARRMVVGHTPHTRGITSTCGDRVWRIDVGMARHYGGKPAVLVIEGETVRSVGT